MPRVFCLPTSFFVGILSAATLFGCSQFQAPQPEQPIQFSHEIHVTQNNIPCLYCHQTADRSEVASVPSTGTCMNCHKAIPGQNMPQEVEKVRGYWERQEPIPWNRVHDEPDFVYFTHERHVKYFTDCFSTHPSTEWDKCALKEVDTPLPAVGQQNPVIASQMMTCAQCHGPVWTFTTGKRVEPLSMGWCVSCHEKRLALAPVEEQPLIRGRMLDCWTCHK